MNAIPKTADTRFRSSVFVKMLATATFLLFQAMMQAETLLKDSLSSAKRDSVQAAASQAIEDAAVMRRDNINTVLEVVGSVLAIVIIIFITWKMSSGSSKQAGPRISGSDRSSDESHREVMQRRMKMEKK